MSFLKLSLILSSAIGTHVAITPPNAPPTAQEVVKPSTREIYMRFIIRAAGPLKVSFWLGTLGQAATILIPLIPPAKLPSGALTLLDALGGPDHRPITTPFLVGSSLVTLGGLLRWACYRALGKLFTFHLSVRKDHRLVTTGPYSVVRHPSYTATGTFLVGVFLMHGHAGSWLRSSGVTDNLWAKATIIAWAGLMCSSTMFLFMRCPAEDEMMRKEFGKEWEEWAGRVKYWLIPGIY